MNQIVFINSNQRREVIKSLPMPYPACWPSVGDGIEISSKEYWVAGLRWDFDKKQLLVFVQALEP